MSWLEALDSALNGAAAAPKMRTAFEAKGVVAAAVVVATGALTTGCFLSSTSSNGISLIRGNSEGTLAGKSVSALAGNTTAVIGAMLEALIDVGAVFEVFRDPTAVFTGIFVAET